MIFKNFDFGVLNDPEFKEDSVREELLLPIVKALGYQVSGDSRVVRSRSLVHPYVALGSQQRKVSIVPDYLFLSDGRPYWVLDAKSPTEEITKSKHVEQAYSYAIHPEVQAELYALCNGKEFALYSVKQFDPILRFKLELIETYWESTYRILNPDIKAHPDLINFHPDYGLHLRMLGAKEGFSCIVSAVNTNHMIKVEDGLYTTNTIIAAEGKYLMSLDFGEKEFSQLLKVLPEYQALLLSTGLKRQPYRVHLDNGEEFSFGVATELTNDIYHNPQESYLPFKVVEIFPYSDFTNEQK
ncbi:MAG: type I restriction enzyme HsdR N-terminal domain-containing protein [Nitrosomonas sp.]|uniref:type I restriction enzyme HsdR N-terminal domain-containing protein n=1 Tax=Nitrosomonas sp. TaxID=42353 RepID=UPI001DE3246A|nr:type I restriction enzyme HsdR N-terminal domain-containing protein [Nitrosomonas sp.]MBX9896118.1 type I restriction enzyme HsdR N-terminal domain-containing protein [Nitrosomonas sp.]